MNFTVELAHWTRAFGMSTDANKPTGHRQVTLMLRPTGVGEGMYLASGGKLFDECEHKWFVGLALMDAGSASWKGEASVRLAGRHVASNNLSFSLRLTREEMDECWNAVTRGILPSSVQLDLDDAEPAITWNKQDQYEREWNNVDHRHVALCSASFHYDEKSSQGLQLQRKLLEALTESRVSVLGTIMVSMLVMILVMLVFRR